MLQVWDIMREYCRLNPPLGSKHRSNNDVSAAILSKPIATKVDFTPVDSVIEKKAAQDVARYPPNPEENWGPKRKAGRLVSKTLKEGDNEGEEVPEKKSKS
jgi:tRNA (guanine26-N2/guanine27-N2)-dimethyltransferase